MFSFGPMQSMVLKGQLILPVSKSLANRMLILRALNHQSLPAYDASWSNDVKCLHGHLSQPTAVYDFKDAGTPLRMFVAYAALTAQKGTITGSDRLKARPLKALLIALESLGAEFDYLEQAYQLPLKVKKPLDSNADFCSVEVHESSQFLSALMLIAPWFKNGLLIESIGREVSSTYKQLSVDCVRQITQVEQLSASRIQVHPISTDAVLLPNDFEADWSSAAFVLAWAALSEQCNILLPHLKADSVQGDAIIQVLLKPWGITCVETKEGLRVIKQSHQSLPSELTFDLQQTPDLFPVLFALCACSQVKACFKGIAHQVHKESDRIQSMLSNFIPFGLKADLDASGDVLYLSKGIDDLAVYTFRSYADHRVIMACSLLALKARVEFEAVHDVAKSFPHFFEKMRTLN